MTLVTIRNRKLESDDVVYSTGEHVRELTCSACGTLVAVIPVEASLRQAEDQVSSTACECTTA